MSARLSAEQLDELRETLTAPPVDMREASLALLAEVDWLTARVMELTRYTGALEAAICQCEPERDGSDYLHAADCAVVPIQMQVFGYQATEAGEPQ